MKKFGLLIAVGSMLLASVMATAADNWTAFGYRKGATVSDMTGGVLQFNVGDTGQKAAWGTNDINGHKLSDITKISITRVATPENGKAPYLNLWLKDSDGNHAILAVTGSIFDSKSNNWSMDWNAMKSQTATLYEIAPSGFVAPTTNPTSVASFADYMIDAPIYTDTYMASFWENALAHDKKAPYDYANQTGYGVNWVFGDSLTNYVGNWQASNPNATAASPVPEPGTILAALSILGPAGIMFRRRRA